MNPSMGVGLRVQHVPTPLHAHSGRFSALGPNDTVAEPIIEEEYFEWGHALMGVASAAPGGTFVVVEIGA
eukprot:6910219-Prymnesium_polylepis.2